MIVCDLTHAYHATSGGIRTYIDAKRDYLLTHTDHHHLLIVPGEADEVERGERWVTVHLASPVIPGAAPYRFFVRPSKVLTALREHAPTVVELNSLYSEPWAAFRYRKGRPDAAVSGYYFTDLPGAYVGPVASRLIGRRLGMGAERTSGRYVRAVFDRCDLRLAPSPEQAARLARFGVEDIHVVMPGVDLATFHPRHRDPALRAELGVAEGGLLCAYAGRLDGEKRVHVLVDAVARLPPELGARLAVAGNGPHRPELEARAAAGDPVVVLPYLDKRGLARLLASSDVYLTAGPHETFGLSVVEAQACGLPVVGVAAGALVERVDESVGRLGPVDDAVAMARNIEEVAPHREVMGRAARRLTEERYSWKTCFDKTLALYDRAVAAKSARS